MKTKINLFLFAALIAAVMSCSDNRSAKDLLSDPEKQDAVLTAIANDSSLLTKLHNKVRTENNMNMGGGSSMMKSCMAMMDDPGMMSMMMDNMMMRCEQDTAMGRMMCDKMMDSENMRSMMQNRMHNDMNMENKK